jgi:uncharacterized protein (DUF1800 family)
MPTNSELPSKAILANIAVNRFGYGAREDEFEQALPNPKQWVKSQLTPVSFDNSLPSSSDIFIVHSKYLKEKKQLKNKKESNEKQKKMMGNSPRAALKDMSVDTLQRAISSSNSVSWRLLDFFSNHFSVTAQGRLMTGLSATLEREAIAPNMLGNFGDLLLAVEQHPAMLIYLNNEKSFGPNSRMAKKRKKGLNENLAREIMELHTLGVNGGYTQHDVIELAKAITGWSVKRPDKEKDTGFIFREYGHEPGTRKLLGKSYPQDGLSQGQKMLTDLAMHPATAKYICYKIAHHFVSDIPSNTLLDKMENTWMKTEGNLTQVMNTLFDSQESWQAGTKKFKTPRDFVISTHRALSEKNIVDKWLLSSLTNLGQQPFNAGSPAGFSDDYQDWLGGNALMARIDWSARVSQSRKRVNTEEVMNSTLGDSISMNTYQAVMRAESRQQALTLLLMSPEFQWR